jgi:hypothetical protein
VRGHITETIPADISTHKKISAKKKKSKKMYTSEIHPSFSSFREKAAKNIFLRKKSSETLDIRRGYRTLD